MRMHQDTRRYAMSCSPPRAHRGCGCAGRRAGLRGERRQQEMHCLQRCEHVAGGLARWAMPPRRLRRQCGAQEVHQGPRVPGLPVSAHMLSAGPRRRCCTVQEKPECCAPEKQLVGSVCPQQVVEQLEAVLHNDAAVRAALVPAAQARLVRLQLR